MAAVAPSGVALRLSRSDIESALEPHVIRRFEPGDETWARHLQTLRKGGRAKLWAARLRRFVGRRVKSVDRVRHDYSGVWSQEQIPGSSTVENARYFLRWGERGFEVRGWAEKRIHLLLFSNLLESLRPANVLEVGSGNGLMLMMLATGHPDIQFTGIELTEVGVGAARRIQDAQSLPPGVLSLLPFRAADPGAFRRVNYMLGNAAQLPFEGRSFDLVMTSLALEQMNEVRHAAFTELARVTRKWVAMLEPFPDFNQAPERAYYTRSRDYLSTAIADLSGYGLTPIQVFDDFPSKVNRGAGLVLATLRAD